MASDDDYRLIVGEARRALERHLEIRSLLDQYRSDIPEPLRQRLLALTREERG